MKKKKTTDRSQVGWRITKANLDFLRRAAAAEDRSVVAYVNRLIEAHRTGAKPS